MRFLKTLYSSYLTTELSQFLSGLCTEQPTWYQAISKQSTELCTTRIPSSALLPGQGLVLFEVLIISVPIKSHCHQRLPGIGFLEQDYVLKESSSVTFILETKILTEAQENRIEKYFFQKTVPATQPSNKGHFPSLGFNSSVEKGWRRKYNTKYHYRVRW